MAQSLAVASHSLRDDAAAEGLDALGLGNLDAERTLLRVKQKLEGRETGVAPL